MQAEDMQVWKRAIRLATEIYLITTEMEPDAFRDIITRAVMRIATNIAQGAECDSPKESVRFFRRARGACAALRTHLYVGIKANVMDKEAAKMHIAETKEISAALLTLVRTIRRKLNGENGE